MPTKTRAPKKQSRAATSRRRSSSATKSKSSTMRRGRAAAGRRTASRRSTAAPSGKTTRGRSQHLSHTTTDHDEIRQWAEERGAHPAAVKRTNRGRSTGILRLDFPGYSGAGSLEEISWDEFFDKFEQSKLALVYQDHTAAGERSNFNKLVKRNRQSARR